jgi:CBS domain-containing protein
MFVKEIMTETVASVLPDASLKAVGRILKEKRISGLPVVDKDFNILGIVTLTDMLKILDQIYRERVEKKERPGSKLIEMYAEEKLNAKVSDIMTKNVFTLEENNTMEDVMGLMFTKGVHTIPIVKNGKVIGIIGKRDLVDTCF